MSNKLKVGYVILAILFLIVIHCSIMVYGFITLNDLNFFESQIAITYSLIFIILVIISTLTFIKVNSLK